MSSSETLARPYARAAFELAREAKSLGEWAQKLDFAAALAADGRVRALIGNPRLSPAQLAGLFLPQGEQVGSAFANFIATLAENRRLALLPDIAQGYAAAKREAEGTLRVRVRAASVLESAQAEALKAALANRFGKRIELDSEVDESLIGGAVIDAGDVVIDGSVRGRLQRLAQTLTH
ncbi:MAG TPA: F0F1 ATP synthase subunit delta [Rhodanobacteraceae bacterium]|nr:F0F1 ATP synthase subunit delta [Rhodanobacteraceae bacterium]